MRIISTFIGLHVCTPYSDTTIALKDVIQIETNEKLVKMHELENGSFIMEYHNGKMNVLKRIERAEFDMLNANLLWKPS